jgi:hypothetical protein
MRITCVILAVLANIIHPLRAQSLTSKEGYKEMPFAKQLIILTNKDSVKYAQLEMVSIKKKMASPGNPEATFSLSDQWELIYFEMYDEEDAGGRKTQAYLACIIPKNKEAFNGSEIFKKFKISDKQLQKTFPLKAIPSVFARNAKFNGTWTPVFTTPDYLMMRLVSSYPDGNYTSWYNETIYYFKRVK